MEFLLGSLGGLGGPYSSPAGLCIAVKKRLNGNRNYREVMLALTVLETCVKNCGHRFHSLVTSRDFIDGVLVKIIAPKNNPPTIVQDKVLALIQAWADAFRSSPDLTGVVQIYEELKRKGMEFPMSQLETLSPIHTPQRVASAPEGDSALHHYSAPPPQTHAPPPAHIIPPVYTTLQAQASVTQQGPGSITPTPEQVTPARREASEAGEEGGPAGATRLEGRPAGAMLGMLLTTAGDPGPRRWRASWDL
ncbi:hypothetical protein CRUP_016800 [Coryphaenoides rupestris]|nr:hypothetical protein CRUP_016800 [Coryphaenoides rupestris]